MPEEEEEKHANIGRCWIKYCINLLEAGIPELAALNETSEPLTYKVEFASIKDDVKDQTVRALVRVCLDIICNTVCSNQTFHNVSRYTKKSHITRV